MYASQFSSLKSNNKIGVIIIITKFIILILTRHIGRSSKDNSATRYGKIGKHQRQISLSYSRRCKWMKKGTYEIYEPMNMKIFYRGSTCICKRFVTGRKASGEFLGALHKLRKYKLTKVTASKVEAEK